MTRQSGRKSTLAWLSAAACLSGVVVLEFSEGIPLAPTVTAAAIDKPDIAPAGSDTLAIEMPAPEILNDIVDRPLFSESRRPFEPAVEERPTTMSAGREPLSLQLVGTMLSGETSLALLKQMDGGLKKLQRGEEIDGWRLDLIDHDRIRLMRNDEIEWLDIRKDMPAKAPRARTPKPKRQTANDGSNVNNGETILPLNPQLVGQQQ